MPYRINKLKKPCKQSDGDTGYWSLTYTDKKGKKHRNCHTSKKNAQGQIAAIEGPRESDEQEDELLVGDDMVNEVVDKVWKRLLNEGHRLVKARRKAG